MNFVEVYADIVCPFTHVGLRRFADAAHSRARLVVRAWPLELVNEAPLDGPTLAPKVLALRTSVAPDLFAAFDVDRFPRTSLLALASAAAAYRVDREVGEKFSLAVRDALFERGEDVSDGVVLARLRHACGVPDPTTADDETVRADLVAGRGRGVRGSPHYFLANGDNYFCPLLQIKHAGDSYQIETETSRFEAFMARAIA